MSGGTAKVGVLGAGQLALMLAEAGQRIGVEVICAGQPGDCAARVAQVVAVDLESAEAVREFAKQVDVVTVESENIDAAVLRGLNLYPNAQAIGVAQERLVEKKYFRECGIGTAPFCAVDTLDGLDAAVRSIGTPAILKTRRMGYDGKGQVRLTDPAQAHAAWDEVGRVPCLLEGMLAFDTEVSLLAARGRGGETVFYPLVENFHREGILRRSLAPYGSDGLQRKAEAYMRKVLAGLDYVGVLAIEFFVRDGDLLANEMAPRVHNSGHWTIEGAKTSQFENHLRAILGWPLGSTESEPMLMLNCIGSIPARAAGLQGAVLHDYGKEFRAGRKVGHVTIPAGQEKAVEELQRVLEEQA